MESGRLYVLLRAGFVVCFKPGVAFFAAMCWLCTALYGQDTASVKRLAEVQVIERTNTINITSPTPAQILKGAALQRLNTLSVADAIRYFSGVQMKDYGGVGGLKTVNVRSLGSSQTAVFYDGLQVNNAQNGQVDLSKFSMDNIGSIELYNAQKNTIFQPARGFAAGNSVYLTTKSPTFKGNSKDLYKATFKTGSFGLVNPSILWQHRISNATFSTLNAEYTHANGRYKFRYTNGVYDTIAVRNNGDINALRFEAGLKTAITDSSSWEIKGYLYNSERGLPGAIIENRFNYNQREWDRNLFVQSGFERRGKIYSVMLKAKYANDYLRYLDPDIITTDGFSDSRYHQQEFYFSVANLLKLEKYWNVSISADYARNAMQSNIFRFVNPLRNTALIAIATQLKWSRFDLQANLLSNIINEHTQTITGKTEYKYTPTIAASWQPFKTEAFRLRGFYKSIYRIPTFNELYYTFVGTANLQPEYSRQLDVGFTFQLTRNSGILRNISIQTDIYGNKVDNKIIAVPSLNLQRWTMQNIGRVNIKGIESNMQSGWYINDEVLINGGLSYTYQQAYDASAGAKAKQQIPYTPLHSGSALAGVLYKNYSVNYSFIYTGERYNQAANIASNYVEPWYTHDLSANWRQPLKDHELNIGAEINNVFNQYYDVVTNFPMPGRFYRLKMTFTY
ncbi:TonB-dependent receptor [Mucilaginibacter aquatilis]|uniref:TonB-dependent receptor n=1 Tax=Mucilaginibacter aquatilis TaxID=1517760 RepID=A0A6I4IQF6_9SPHI|nr:TonB-dependent receptor [Mucilaginibacter aquatilis]MVN91603.1 TonB-dependent receptor [Mucilaginibacter aquatilis]